MSAFARVNKAQLLPDFYEVDPKVSFFCHYRRQSVCLQKIALASDFHSAETGAFGFSSDLTSTFLKLSKRPMLWFP